MQLFVATFQLFVATLQLFVATFRLLVEMLQLFVATLQLFVEILRLFVATLQLLVETLLLFVEKFGRFPPFDHCSPIYGVPLSQIHKANSTAAASACPLVEYFILNYLHQFASELGLYFHLNYLFEILSVANLLQMLLHENIWCFLLELLFYGFHLE